MKEEIESQIKHLWNDHRSSSIGAIAGILFSVLVLIFGFWNIIFVILCSSVGIYIGTKLDNGENILTRFGDYIKEHWEKRLRYESKRSERSGV